MLTSQVQHVWRTVQNKRLPPKVIEAAFLAPTDITVLVRFDLLKHAVVATLLAIAAWGMPISAIITPSTLTVTDHTSSRTVVGIVPAVDFADYKRWATLNFIDNYQKCFNDYFQGGDCDREGPEDTPMMIWRNYSPQLGLHVIASTSSGRIEPMTPEFINSTYSLQFEGPSIRCRNATERREEFKGLAGFDKLQEVRYAAFIPVLNRTGETYAYKMDGSTNGTRRLGYGLELWMVTNSVVFSKSDEIDYLVKAAYICTMYNST
jgi:hypothetical protein